MADFQTDIFGGRVAVNVEDDEQEISTRIESNFNIFSLTDAIAAKDKKQAWILYHKALAEGMAAEEIFWKMVWIVKSMLIASRTTDYKETDMKEFPYKKAKGALKHWKPGELEILSESLVVSYHEARRGLLDLELFIEKVILSL